jgi:hypothetical protein
MKISHPVKRAAYVQNRTLCLHGRPVRTTSFVQPTRALVQPMSAATPTPDETYCYLRPDRRSRSSSRSDVVVRIGQSFDKKILANYVQQALPRGVICRCSNTGLSNERRVEWRGSPFHQHVQQALGVTPQL